MAFLRYSGNYTGKYLKQIISHIVHLDVENFWIGHGDKEIDMDNLLKDQGFGDRTPGSLHMDGFRAAFPHRCSMQSSAGTL